MVKSRDFITIAGVILRENVVYVIAKGIDDEIKYPESKNCVRGILKIAGWII